jgi:LPS-assembly lipoprotein
MRKQYISHLSVLFLAALLAGCGFHLRGTGNSATILPEEWKSMSLSTGNPNSEFSRELISRFEANGVVWTDAKSANYRLKISGAKFDQRNLTLNSEARAAEYELTMTARFTVFNADGSVALKDTKASIVKQMENDPRNVVGKAEEIRLMQQEMRAELAQQIMRRIGFFATSLRETDSGGAAADPNDASVDPSSAKGQE